MTALNHISSALVKFKDDVSCFRLLSPPQETLWEMSIFLTIRSLKSNGNFCLLLLISWHPSVKDWLFQRHAFALSISNVSVIFIRVNEKQKTARLSWKCRSLCCSYERHGRFTVTRMRGMTFVDVEVSLFLATFIVILGMSTFGKRQRCLDRVGLFKPSIQCPKGHQT